MPRGKLNGTGSYSVKLILELGVNGKNNACFRFLEGALKFH